MNANREHICTAGCFEIVRDGVTLRTRECKHAIARANAADHERRKSWQRFWSEGPKQERREKGK